MNTLNITTARAANKAAKTEVKTLNGARNLLLSLVDDLTITTDDKGKYTNVKAEIVNTYPFPSEWLKVLKASKRNPAIYKAMAANVRSHHKTGSYSPYYILEAFSNADKFSAMADPTKVKAAKPAKETPKAKKAKAAIMAKVNAADKVREDKRKAKAAKAAANVKAVKELI